MVGKSVSTLVLTAVATFLGASPAFSQASPPYASKVCQDIFQKLGTDEKTLESGEHHYRQMPTLTPNRHGVLALDLDMMRYGEPRDTFAPPPYVFIGKYKVTGVPVLSIRPRHGVFTYVMTDPVTKVSTAIPGECLASPQMAYGGTRWKLKQGDSIEARLTSKLDFTPDEMMPPKNGGVPLNTGNNHTHGLLVAPMDPSEPPYDKPANKGRFGDFIFNVAKPGTPPETIDYRIAIPHGKPASAACKSDPTASGCHPSGGNWYHPHPHGYSRPLLNGGTTGIITIGALCDSFPASPVCHQALEANVKHIMLKDAQIAPQAGSGFWKMNAGFAFGDCLDTSEEKTRGECILAKDDAGAVQSLWLFTLNGMQFPMLETVPGRSEIWRLTNASPNTTYRLAVTSPDGAKRLPFKVLLIDGVAATGSQDEILMMPGSRVDVAVDIPVGGTYILRQLGLYSGKDIFPPVQLARVRSGVKTPAVVASDSVSARARSTAVRVAAEKSFDLRSLEALKPNLGRSGRDADSSENRFALPGTPVPQTMMAVAGVKPVCSALLPNEVRKIYFIWEENHADLKKPEKSPGVPDTKEVFGLIAAKASPTGMVFYDPAGNAVTGKTSAEIYAALAVKANPNGIAFGAHNYGDICLPRAKPAESEVWILENWTPEIHNFHIHQTKFSLETKLAENKDNFNAALSSASATCSQIAQNPDDESKKDQTQCLMQNIWKKAAEAKSAGGGTVGDATNMHDTIPVPMARGAACNGAPEVKDCAPGRITIRIRFDREEQIGQFVYHCHILEHEDNGMMASIRVYDRNNPPPAVLKGAAPSGHSGHTGHGG